MTRRQKWLRQLAPALKDSTGDLPRCPVCGRMKVRIAYVGDKVRRVGTMYSWCDACLNGVRVSSASAPGHFQVIPFDAAGTEGPPSFNDLED
jgi:hypothetical protein